MAPFNYYYYYFFKRVEKEPPFFALLMLAVARAFSILSTFLTLLYREREGGGLF